MPELFLQEKEMTKKKRDSLIQSMVHGRGLIILVCAGLLYVNNGDMNATTSAITKFGVGVAAMAASISKIREVLGE